MARPALNSPDTLRQISITTRPDAEADVAELLESEFNQKASSYTDVATGHCTVSVYWGLPAGEMPEARAVLRDGLRELAESGIEVGPGRIGIRKVPARDWSESWKRHFQPIEIGGKLLVKPTWNRRKPKPGQQVVLLDPGLSFGTGQHATTRFCLGRLVALRRPGTSQSLLDAGTGSGILAIAAAKLGYAPVKAFDYDAEAVRIARGNCDLNEVEDQVQPTQADLTRLPRKSQEQFDVVCANLVHDLLISERDRLRARLKPGGALVVAGILTSQFPEVRCAFAELGLTLVTAKTEQEWRSGLFRAP
jgi:ribosomal protein L11 methyltransferase